MKKHIKTMNTKSFSRRQFLELNLGAAVAAGVGMSPLFGGSGSGGNCGQQSHSRGAGTVRWQ